MSSGSNGISRLNGDNGGFTKHSQTMHPSKGFVWTEGADMRGEDAGSWDMQNIGSAANHSMAVFGDSPADLHVIAMCLNFADGHAESRKRKDGTTITFANSIDLTKDAGSAVETTAQHPGNVDAIWIGSHYTGPQNP